MKELIVIVGTILLGCIIFTMIAGEENSLKEISSKKIEQMMDYYEERSYQ